MIEDQDLVIEPLSSAHDRAGFSCYEYSLDNYMKKKP